MVLSHTQGSGQWFTRSGHDRHRLRASQRWVPTRKNTHVILFFGNANIYGVAFNDTVFYKLSRAGDADHSG